MRKSLYLALCVSMFFIFTSCGKDEPAADLLDFKCLSNATVEYEITKVRRGDLREIINVKDIHVFPKVRTNITFEEDVVLKTVYVKYDQIIKKGELIAELDTQKIDEKIQYQEFEIEMEKVLYSDMKSSGISEEELKIKELDIKILETDFKKMKQDREKYKIYAQKDCYISKGSMVSGRKVEAGESLFIITNASEFTMKTIKKVNLDKYTNVKIGDQVELTYPGQTFRGEVSFITFDERNFGRIHFRASDDVSFGEKKIREIFLSAKLDSIISEDVLTLPSMAIKDNQKKYVELLKDGVRRIRYIKCGVKGYDEKNQRIIQVVGGLKEGETVILKTKSKSQ